MTAVATSWLEDQHGAARRAALETTQETWAEAWRREIADGPWLTLLALVAGAISGAALTIAFGGITR